MSFKPSKCNAKWWCCRTAPQFYSIPLFLWSSATLKEVDQIQQEAGKYSNTFQTETWILGALAKETIICSNPSYDTHTYRVRQWHKKRQSERVLTTPHHYPIYKVWTKEKCLGDDPFKGNQKVRKKRGKDVDPWLWLGLMSCATWLSQTPFCLVTTCK